MRLSNVNPVNLSRWRLHWLRPADDYANRAPLLYQWMSVVDGDGDELPGSAEVHANSLAGPRMSATARFLPILALPKKEPSTGKSGNSDD